MDAFVLASSAFPSAPGPRIGGAILAFLLVVLVALVDVLLAADGDDWTVLAPILPIAVAFLLLLLSYVLRAE